MVQVKPEGVPAACLNRPASVPPPKPSKKRVREDSPEDVPPNEVRPADVAERLPLHAPRTIVAAPSRAMKPEPAEDGGTRDLAKMTPKELNTNFYNRMRNAPEWPKKLWEDDYKKRKRSDPHRQAMLKAVASLVSNDFETSPVLLKLRRIQKENASSATTGWISYATLEKEKGPIVALKLAENKRLPSKLDPDLDFEGHGVPWPHSHVFKRTVAETTLTTRTIEEDTVQTGDTDGTDEAAAMAFNIQFDESSHVDCGGGGGSDAGTGSSNDHTNPDSTSGSALAPKEKIEAVVNNSEKSHAEFDKKKRNLLKTLSRSALSDNTRGGKVESDLKQMFDECVAIDTDIWDLEMKVSCGDDVTLEMLQSQLEAMTQLYTTMKAAIAKAEGLSEMFNI